jgi:hypothetical protein
MLNLSRITVLLSDIELDALVILARNERRDARSQASIIIRKELLRLKLLDPESKQSKSELQEAQHGPNNS